jgi:hypothetical protein
MSQEIDVTPPKPPPKCKCGAVNAGQLAAKPNEAEDVVRVTLHFVDMCLEQAVAAPWWQHFMQAFFLPAQQERASAAQMLAAVVGSYGGAIRFHVPTEMKKAMETNFRLDMIPEQDGHLNIKTHGSNLVITNRMPPVLPFRGKNGPVK